MAAGRVNAWQVHAWTQRMQCYANLAELTVKYLCTRITVLGCPADLRPSSQGRVRVRQFCGSSAG